MRRCIGPSTPRQRPPGSMTRAPGRRRIRAWPTASRARPTCVTRRGGPLANPASAGNFKAYDLNLPQAPTREMIFDVADWLRCVVPADELPPRDGRCVVGFDNGRL